MFDTLAPMINFTTTRRAFLAAIATVLLAACGAAAPDPVTIDAIPHFSSAKATSNAAYAPIATGMVDALKAIPGFKADSVKSRLETLPTTVGWDEVKKFYEGELTKAGWSSGANYAFSQGNVNGQGWVRGKQVVFVYHVGEKALPDFLLITAFIELT